MVPETTPPKRSLPGIGHMSITDRLKLVQGISKNILRQVQTKDTDTETLYDGGSALFNNWWRAAVNQFSGIYLDHLEDITKNEDTDELDEDEWEELVSQSDRQFIYQVLTSTITQAQTTEKSQAKTKPRATNSCQNSGRNSMLEVTKRKSTGCST